MEKELKKRITRIIIVLLFLIFSSVIWKDANNNMVNAKKYLENKKTSFIELSNGINIDNAYPVNDEIGSQGDSYKFKIINNDNKNKTITIGVINNLNNNFISYNNIRYQVIKNNEIFIKSQDLNNNGILFNDEITKENTYEIRFWINQNTPFDEILDKSFSIKIALL